MKHHTTMQRRGQAGFSIIEVMIAVLVFAVGMLALGYLQTTLTRSQADANSRAVATNIAERIIERSRGFATLAAGVDDGLFAYDEIREGIILNGSGTEIPGVGTSVTLGGTVYTIAPNVVDYRWNGTDFVCYSDEFDNGNEPSGRCIAGGPPAGSGPYSDIKLLEITVSWDGADFVSGPGTSVGNLGSESVTLSSFLSSVTSPVAARVQNNTGGGVLPAISYTPGARPEIVRLGLGGNKFKESTLVEPNVRRGDIIETSWDVITYATNNTGAEFLRREEFVNVPCECTLNAAPANAVGKTPAVWAGDEYSIGEPVTKQFGTRVANVGSDLCDRCCRDHHDNRPAANPDYTKVYTPWRTDYNAAGNHVHYRFNQATGTLIPAAVGQTYLEACRMVRVNGFWQVAQDVRSADRFVFPSDWLDEDAEVATYSTYITGTLPAAPAEPDTTADGAVELYVNAAKVPLLGYPAVQPCIGAGNCPSPIKEPVFSGAYPTPLEAGKFPSWTNVVAGGASKQLRSRSLYIDYMSPDLLALITCLQGVTDVDALPAACKVGGKPGVGDAVLDVGSTSNALEIIPFYDAQLTKLNSWSEKPIGQFARISNAPIETNNTHDRGRATGLSLGDSGAEASIYVGNLGLLGSDRYVPTTQQPLVTKELDLRVTDASGNDGGVTPVPTGPPISGRFSKSITGNPSAIIVGENGANCSGDYAVGWTCTVIIGSTNPRLRVSGYGKGGANPPSRWACSVGNVLVRVAAASSSNGVNPYSTFELTGAVGTGYNINIQETACP